MDEWTTAIWIGSNLGDRLKNVQEAIAALRLFLDDMEVSSILESEALLAPASPPDWDRPFLNCAVLGRTRLSPRALLEALQQLEQRIGGPRQRGRWSPRALDLDILTYGEETIEEEDLTIPHKEISNRPFVLRLMAEIMPFWKSLGKPVIEWLHEAPSPFIRHLVSKPYLVGVVNVTPDSFSDGGLFLSPEKAAEQAQKLLDEGASFIDLGAASTRPGAPILSANEEWLRLKPALAAVRKIAPCPRVSIDTYHCETALRALDEYDVEMINFLGSKVDRPLASQIEKKKKQIVLMHRLTLPPSASTVLPFHKDPIEPILQWAERQIEELSISKERIAIDPGIGFGKTAVQNLFILKNIRRLRALGTQLYVGHSRKSFHAFFSPKKAAERDLEGTAFSIHLAQEGVDYLRVHNVQAHMELLVAHQALSIGGAHAFS